MSLRPDQLLDYYTIAPRTFFGQCVQKFSVKSFCITAVDCAFPLKCGSVSEPEGKSMHGAEVETN